MFLFLVLLIARLAAADWLDESMDNDTSSAVECGEEEWSCRAPALSTDSAPALSSAPSCIPLSWVCDNRADCQDGSDEGVCSHTCLAQELACGNGLCVHRGWRCDGEDDCGDGSDEAGCGPAECGAGELACAGGSQCVLTSHVCDGDRDCRDGGDEINCGSRLANRTVPCGPTEFSCAELPFCVAADWVCDGERDCPDGSDEAVSVCGEAPARLPLPAAPDPAVTASRAGECGAWPPACSQVCQSGPAGDPRCSCVRGYKPDPVDATRCKAGEGHPSLLFAHKTDIRKLSLDRPSITAIVNNTRSACAVDFHFKTGMVFWSDVREERIYRAPIDSGYPDQALLTQAVVTADGLAVDWVYSHLYWTDAGADTISVSELSGSGRCEVVRGGLAEPRAVALHPGAGLLFWTDWGGPGSVERAGMDGSDRQQILTGLRWPNGLTVDLVLDRLYWVDAKLHTLGCSGLDGGEVRTVLSSPHYLAHPFSVAVFADTVYWTEWDTHAIYQADKFTGANVSLVTSTDSVHLPMVVQVYHPYRQPDYPNLCLPFNGHCSHLCVPRPLQATACLCPVGLELQADNRTCSTRGEAGGGEESGVEKTDSTRQPAYRTSVQAPVVNSLASHGTKNNQTKPDQTKPSPTKP